MGLASFNRSRRERAKHVEILEAERFDKWRKRQTAQNVLTDTDDAAAQATARKAELKATAAIGKKAREGMKSKVIDEPLRKDHAAEIAGRDLSDVQGEGKTAVERVEARIPQGTTANEKLVARTQVDQPGPTPAMLQAADDELNASRKEQEAKDAAEAEARAKEGTAAAAAPKSKRSRAKGGTSAKPVAISDNWRDLPPAKQKALAKRVSGKSVKTVADAEKAILAELEKRSA